MSAASVPPDVLSGRVSEFVAFLRGQGMRVGVGSELDLGNALGHLRILSRRDVLDACRVTLAKSPADLTLLEEAFDRFWSSPPSGTRGGTPAPPAPRRPPSDETSGRPKGPAPVVTTEALGRIRVGTYSPDAPPPGHPLRALERRRFLAQQSGIRRLRRVASTLPGRRMRPSRRGDIDFLATARRSLRQGGEMMTIRRERRRRLRAELVVLWDISGSMREHDSTLFALLHSLTRLNRRCRVFAFSTSVVDITDRVRGTAYPRARAHVARWLAPMEGGTRIAESLRAFRQRYGRFVHPWTTVVLVSDGWDLGSPEDLRRECEWLHRHGHLVVWVNPYAARPGFQPQTEGLRAALPSIDLLLAPEDFELRERFRGLRGRSPTSGI